MKKHFIEKKAKRLLPLSEVRLLSLVLVLVLLLTGCSSGRSGSKFSGGENSLVLDYIDVGKDSDEQGKEESDSGNWFDHIRRILMADSSSETHKRSSNDADNSKDAEPNSVADIYEQGTTNYDNQQNVPETVPDSEQLDSTPPGKKPTPPSANNEGRDNDDGQDDGLLPDNSLPDQNKPNPTKSSPNTDSVTMSINCHTAVANGMAKESKWAGIVPASGVILAETEFEIKDGATVLDVLKLARDKYKLHMEYSGGDSSGAYVEGINNLYEFDGGRWSGWMYCVNGWYPNYGCGVYYLKPGDKIQWNYTCNLGLDLNAGMEGAEDWMETHD